MSTLTASSTPSRAANIVLWIVQIGLAAAFLMAGLTKVMQPIPDLAAMMVWPGDVPAWLVRFIGLSETLGAIGLIVPALTRILPKLTPAAGIGLATIMVLAAGFHTLRGEFGALPINAVLGLTAGFVAWGRVSLAPIAPRP
jgi:uncharacterized membrane protein YphA (DoxX/SURF4 family)